MRADHNRTRGADRGNAVAGNGAIDAKHVDVIAQHHEVVGRVVARQQSFIVQHRHSLIGAHRKVTSEATRGPGGVAALAAHPARRVRELREVVLVGDRSPAYPVSLDRLSQT